MIPNRPLVTLSQISTNSMDFGEGWGLGTASRLRSARGNEF